MKFLFMSLQTLGELRNGIHNQLRASTTYLLVFEKKNAMDEKIKVNCHWSAKFGFPWLIYG